MNAFPQFNLQPFNFTPPTFDYKNNTVNPFIQVQKTEQINPFSLQEKNNIKTLIELKEALWLECSKYTSDPELEALDAKLEKQYYYDYESEEERPSFEDDEDDEVSHFNKLNQSSFTKKDLELLKKYAASNMITLTDAFYYSQVCHNCNTYFDQDEDSLYGNLYCSKKCEKEVQVYQLPCYYKKYSNCRRGDYSDCDICSNPNKVALFNAQYNTNFDETKINETREFAKVNYLTISESIYYMSQCHYCGNNNINYGDMYCNERCCNYVEDFRYSCSHADYCKLCSNYVSEEEKNLRHRLFMKQYKHVI
jgi:hypothetical protein